MTDNVLNFPSKEKIDANTVLNDAMDKLEDCILIGTTKDGESYYSICAQDAQQVIFLLRMMEHLVIANELT
jgi:hypothetical protein